MAIEPPKDVRETCDADQVQSRLCILEFGDALLQYLMTYAKAYTFIPRLFAHVLRALGNLLTGNHN